MLIHASIAAMYMYTMYRCVDTMYMYMYIYTMYRCVDTMYMYTMYRCVDTMYMYTMYRCVDTMYMYTMYRCVDTIYMYTMYRCGYLVVFVSVHVLMRDEKEGRKKQARSNKQQGKATQHTQGSHFS